MALIEDLNQGVIDGFLVSPVRREALIAGRAATANHPNWGLVASRPGFLVLRTALCLTLATRAFKSYQRSV